eukprot:TRINITY_DN3617_c0_g1_i1.p1 TRINITY_DN3617_c0_g1~~TRINITY_DN3617_c0_g1_i1.p1  ORF type:complete len:369 (-),score=75.28 TRINITY_DN3617_c0_g1_i1:102-1208(-)
MAAVAAGEEEEEGPMGLLEVREASTAALHKRGGACGRAALDCVRNADMYPYEPQEEHVKYKTVVGSVVSAFVVLVMFSYVVHTTRSFFIDPSSERQHLAPTNKDEIFTTPTGVAVWVRECRGEPPPSIQWKLYQGVRNHSKDSDEDLDLHEIQPIECKPEWGPTTDRGECLFACAPLVEINGFSEETEVRRWFYFQMTNTDLESNASWTWLTGHRVSLRISYPYYISAWDKPQTLSFETYLGVVDSLVQSMEVHLQPVHLTDEPHFLPYLPWLNPPAKKTFTLVDDTIQFTEELRTSNPARMSMIRLTPARITLVRNISYTTVGDLLAAWGGMLGLLELLGVLSVWWGKFWYRREMGGRAFHSVSETP